MRYLSLLVLFLAFAWVTLAPLSGCSALSSLLSPSPTATPTAVSTAQKVAACIAQTDVTTTQAIPAQQRLTTAAQTCLTEF